MSDSASPYRNAPALAQALALPNAAYVGQRIAKTLFIEQVANLPGTTAADKRLATNGLAELHWLAALKPGTCGLAVWQTDTYEYLEIAVLHAVLRSTASAAACATSAKASLQPIAQQTAQTSRLLELIHRTIPYPVVLVVTQAGGGAEQLSLAHKRLSLGKGSAMVLEHSNTTKIIANNAGATGAAGQFVQYIAFNTSPQASQRDLYARYSDWLNAIDALAASEHTGQFIVSLTAQHAQRRRSALQTHAQLGQQLASLRAKAKKASQLAQRASLNLQIASLMTQRQAWLSKL